MNDLLAYFGTEPRLLGLATLGGLISLVIVIVQLVRALVPIKGYVSKGWVGRRRSKMKAQILEFREARSRKRLGFSDFVVALNRLDDAVNSLKTMALGLIILALNGSIYLANGSRLSGFVSAVQISLVIWDFSRACGHLHRALFVVAAANYPSSYRKSFLEKLAEMKRK